MRKGTLVSYLGELAEVVRTRQVGGDTAHDLSNGVTVVPRYAGEDFRIVALPKELAAARRIAAKSGGHIVDLKRPENEPLSKVFGRKHGQRTVAGITGEVVVVDGLCHFYSRR